ncbi:cyclic pyranopterin monophosphate synthase MoaC [Aliidiomarina sanyensis]|uniref:Cyclic pyranopterin monophosphate synthase n=1 Tax=Aliidiomarina sanyensis TaxID=1249555 RepID=A0A432WRI1_9GAMM|nr:cyclic pyranopterin monophosphate synthase MoaC [Aliidiomarina sanyensis]RUO36371.1 cyclic pyranopterin monophosphate synthase MoaC [Aliidiomarina sanyensis]
MNHELTHLNQSGEAHMVDVSQKETTHRMARAGAVLQTNQDVVALVEQASAKKGDVIATARIAGIMAAKKTSDLIPLCHPLALTQVSIDVEMQPQQGRIYLTAQCVVAGQTGVEMEALTAVSIAALTLYDMCKAVDPSMTIEQTYLIEKTGGKKGHWKSVKGNLAHHATRDLG